MKRLFYILTLIFLFAGTMSKAQEANSYVTLYFKVNRTVVDTMLFDNGARMNEFVDGINYIINSPSQKVLKVEIVSSASPEGPIKHNEFLARERANAARQYLSQYISFEDSIISIDSRTIDWEHLVRLVEEDEANIPNSKEIQDIIARTNERDTVNGVVVNKRNQVLQTIDSGEAWDYMFENFFPEMRQATIIVTYERRAHMLGAPAVQPIQETATLDAESAPLLMMPQIAPVRTKVGSLYVKTNIPAWGLLIGNLGAEYCFAQNAFSVNLHVYYTALNHFVETRKFRTFAVQPEFRYYIPKTGLRGTRGLFVGAHAGMAYYNLALESSEYRYQDHNGTSPAWGGGLSLGYRLPLSRDNKWNLEFVVGAGIYGLHYDTFYNVPNGKLTGTFYETYYGIDNAGITLSYRFDITKIKK
ncbi:MAG: DUF3575 domain-containing protein [Bacteroidaceae bacterium]|nr:DUF3575 domain-containing protein [Bacteroidaceae bacterium]